MISNIILNTINNLTKKFPFDQLTTTLTPFVQIAYIIDNELFSEVSASLFFKSPGSDLHTKSTGRELVAESQTHRAFSTTHIHLMQGTKVSISNNSGKTTIIRLKYGEFLSITVLTPNSADQNLITDAIIKELAS